MKPAPPDAASSPALHGNEEIIELIETLHRTEKRLEELTAGEVDSVSDESGKAYLLRRPQDRLRTAERVRKADALNALHVSESRFRQMAENIRDAFFLREPNGGRVLYVSPAYEEIWGRSCESLYEDSTSWMAAIHPEDSEAVTRMDVAGALAGRFSFDYRIIRPDGSVRWIRARGFPVQEQHRMVGIAGVAQDITLTKTAEIALWRSTRALKMLTACNEALIRATGEDALLEDICRIAVDVGGYRTADIGFTDPGDPTRTIGKAHAGGDDAAFSQAAMTWALERLAEQGVLTDAEHPNNVVFSTHLASEPALSTIETSVRAAHIGSAVFLPLRGGQGTIGLLALYSPEGASAGADEMALIRQLADDLAFGIGALRSRAEGAKTETALLASVVEKDALLKEVHHRVKNNLQVITSLLSLESRRIEHPSTRAVLQGMKDRIFAMAAVHESLYSSGNFAEVDLGAYLERLTHHLSRSLIPGPTKIRFELDLLPVRLNLEQAVPCGLIVNELVSNAVKHGFPDGRSGAVRIALRRVADERIGLCVSDDGIGLPSDFPKRQTASLGLRLVTDLTNQLHGTLEIGVASASSFDVTFAPGSSDS